MRIAIAFALAASVTTAHACAREQFETILGGCLTIPVGIEGPTFKVVFEITLDSATRAQKVDVIDYEPKSEVTAKAATKLATQIKDRCWPLGVKEKSPIRLAFSLDLP